MAAAALGLAASLLPAHPAGAVPPPLPYWKAVTRIDLRATYRPFVGDFDGDGFDDVFWYAPGTQSDHLWLGGGGPIAGAFTDVAGSPQVNGTYWPVVGDFGGDGAEDIFWHGPGRAPDSLWVMRRNQTRPAVIRAATVSGDYRPVAIDEATGKDGIAWLPGRCASSVRLWSYVSGTPVGSSTGPVCGEPAIGDFDGNGRQDLLWKDSPAPTVTWRTGTTGLASTAVDVPYSDEGVLAAVGDLDADGVDDVYLQDVQNLADDGDGADTATTWFGSAGRTFTAVTSPAQIGGPEVVRFRGAAADDVLLRDTTDHVITFPGRVPSARPIPADPLGHLGADLFGTFVPGQHDSRLAVSPYIPSGPATWYLSTTVS